MVFVGTRSNEFFFVSSLLSILSAVFFVFVLFRVSFKTLKLGAVKMSSLLLFSIQAAKKQGALSLSIF